MPTPRAIVFDLDGTLLDSREDVAAAMDRALRSRGHRPLDAAIFRQFVSDGARALSARAAGLAEEDPEVVAIMDAFVQCYVEHPADRTTLMPGARAVLDELRAYQLAVCTNKPRPATLAVLEALGIADRFATLMTEGDIPERKPDPKPILAIASRLAVLPEQMVMVGDGAQDVEAGRRAGARTVGVVGNIVPERELRAARPDVLITSMAELPAVLERWATG